MTGFPPTLKEKLLKVRPRETSGSRTSKRFDFQKNWALCKLLECHKSGKSYALILDYHDDILLLDSESDPKEVHFYQVKTKEDGHWTLTLLLKRKKGKDGPLLSPLAKLFYNKLTFPDETKSLNFVSNARFNLNLKPTDTSEPSLTKSSIQAREIADADLVKVRTQLKAEHSRSLIPDYEDTTFFIATDLSLPDHEAHTKGKLNDFLEDLFSNRKFQLSTIYRAIFDEIKRKNNYDALPSNFLELIDRKSIGKTSFQSMLDALGIRTDLDEGWDTLEARLQAEQFPLSSLIRVKTQWKRYEVDRMDAINLVIQRLKQIILSIVSTQSITTTLTKFIETAYESCRKETNSPVTGLRTEYVQAAILMEHYEQLKLSEVDPKSEEEEA